ncbi:iron-containing alcohol dehydrogenase family protein [Sporosarcina soli]|uniref:Iron-containing alcohol dehydrogenase family protein n=1 Tax=Sporosarcina soli TaxID=334736 RepID=A0ABW0TKI2_9BACL
MKDFQYLFSAQQVVFGPGSLSKIAEVTEQFHLKRMMLFTTKGFRTRGYVDSIENMLGERLVVAYDQVQPHVQDFQVREALAIAEEQQIDAVIGLGGGSAVGIAKAISLALEEKRTGSPAKAAFPTEQPLIPVIAIPTTYAGSEMTPVYGITHEQGTIKRKITVKDVKITPKLTIYDPELTLELPQGVTAGSGINAFAHCIEALYSITKNPLSTAAALGGIRSIGQSLVQCVVDGRSLAARTEMLNGSFLAGVALSNVDMGLHHGICHVLGGSAGVSHGDANSIMLSHVMRFNLDVTANELALAAEAMGISTVGMSAEEAGAASADRVAEWVKQMNLPSRLRDVGVDKTDIPHLAKVAFESRTVRNNPKRIENVEQLEQLLQAAW